MAVGPERTNGVLAPASRLGTRDCPVRVCLYYGLSPDSTPLERRYNTGRTSRIRAGQIDDPAQEVRLKALGISSVSLVA